MKNLAASFLLVTFGISAAGETLGRPRGEVEFSALQKTKAVNAGSVFEVELKWTLPKGMELIDVKWPALNYFGNPLGYQGVVILTAKLRAGGPISRLSLGVTSSLQVCKGICKLGEATRQVRLTVQK